MSILFSAWTVIVAIVFFGIVFWVLKQKNFDEAANLPFDEEPLQLDKKGDGDA